MKLDKTISPFEQMRAAKAQGVPLIADLLGERMGDKAAFVSVASYLSDMMGDDIIIYEASESGMSDFSLKPYEKNLYPYGIHVAQLPPDSDISKVGLDIHTLGLGGNYESLWALNAYLHAKGHKVTLPRNRWTGDHEEYIIFCMLDGTTYNERRDMEVECAIQTVKSLRERGYKVRVIGMKQYGELEADVLPFGEAFELVMNAQLVISGDTGFSHIAALFDIPLVALYPDWIYHGVTSLTKNIALAEWWGLPLEATYGAFIPNAGEDMRVVEIGTDHRWSIDAVVEAVSYLTTSRKRRSASLEAAGEANEAETVTIPEFTGDVPVSC